MSIILFAIAVIVLVAMLAGTVWSAVVPDRRIWPPPRRRSWQYSLAWAGFCAVIGINILLLFMCWNSWVFQSPLRFAVGIPMVVLGGGLALWGVVSEGVKNSLGLKEGFVSSGPYRFTRNPQYLGDIVVFVGICVIANSLLLWITHLLTAVWFLVAPLAEEPWLEEQYGEAYLDYRRRVRRFL